MSASSSSPGTLFARIFRCVDICLACQPHLRPLHLPPEVTLKELSDAIFIEKNSIYDLFTSNISAMILCFYYGGCSKKTTIDESHLEHILYLASESLITILDSKNSLSLVASQQVFSKLEFPQSIEYINELLQKTNTLCKEIMLEIHSVLDTVKRQDFKSLRFNSKTSPVEAMGAHSMRLFCILASAHVLLLLYQRKVEHYPPGLVETVFFGSCISDATYSSTDESAQGTSGGGITATVQRQQRCVELSQRLCAAVCALVLDSSRLLKIWMQREKAVKKLLTPEVEYSRFVCRSYEAYLATTISKVDPSTTFGFNQLSVKWLPPQAAHDATDEELQANTGSALDLINLALKNPAIAAMMAFLRNPISGSTAIPRKPGTSSPLRPRGSSHATQHKLLSKVIDPCSILFAILQYTLDFVCNKAPVSFDDTVLPSLTEQERGLHSQLDTLLTPSPKKKSKDLTLAETLEAVSRRARLEAELHSVQRELRSQRSHSVDQRLVMKREEMTQALSTLHFTEDQLSHEVSPIWGISVQIKRRKDLLKRLSESSSITAALQDTAAIQEAKIHIQELILTRAVDDRMAVKQLREQVERDSACVEAVVAERRREEREAREQQRRWHLESLKIRNTLRTERLTVPLLTSAGRLRQSQEKDEVLPESASSSPVRVDSPPVRLNNPTRGLSSKQIGTADQRETGGVVKAGETKKLAVNGPPPSKSNTVHDTIEALVWEAEEARRRREEAEDRRRADERRRRHRLEEELTRAKTRLSTGTFLWHNGKFGYYDNVRVDAAAQEAANWFEYRDAQGYSYYYNKISQVSQYEYPANATTIQSGDAYYQYT